MTRIIHHFLRTQKHFKQSDFDLTYIEHTLASNFFFKMVINIDSVRPLEFSSFCIRESKE